MPASISRRPVLAEALHLLLSGLMEWWKQRLRNKGSELNPNSTSAP